MPLRSPKASPSLPCLGLFTLNPQPARGGVAFLFRSRLDLKLRPDLSGPDFIAASLGIILLVCFYIPPHNSEWADRYCPSAWARFESVVALSAHSSTPVIALGDANARTGSLSSHPEIYTRSSPDHSICARGRELVKHCASANWQIVNGRSPASMKFTSYQGNGQAVVDYALVSSALMSPNTSLFIPDDADWSDHTFLQLSVPLPPHLLPQMLPPRSVSKKISPAKSMRDSIDLSQPLNHAFSNLLACRPSRTLLSSSLYGFTSEHPPPLIIYTCATNPGGRAGKAFAASFHGPNCPLNLACQIPGSQSYTRASLFAIWMAIRDAPLSRSLDIFYCARSVFTDLLVTAGRDAERGWRGPNADIIKCIVLAVRSRYFSPFPLISLFHSDRLCGQALPRCLEVPPTLTTPWLSLPRSSSLLNSAMSHSCAATGHAGTSLHIFP